MAACTHTTLEPRRGTAPCLARVLTSPIAGEILLGSDATGGPVLRIPASTGRANIEAAVAALVDLLARMDAPLQDCEPAEASPLTVRFDATFQGITPTADQVRAAYRSNGDRLPANLRTGFARALFG
ncbi:hypothetical protein JMJ56_32015 [Belnapia sp. T18]|uniref:Uncharacterized protein n=1 Tax=Belnapia arida TaxID=2804533 RepID=A0ABS1UD27_9PROT|nr:hypothetical protein [Belnapia arida]MBL6082593.1 hypothetical protein [Belnapia arida]